MLHKGFSILVRLEMYEKAVSVAAKTREVNASAMRKYKFFMNAGRACVLKCLMRLRPLEKKRY